MSLCHCIAKAMVFPVVLYGYENWTINKAERQRIDAFDLWCWRRLLRVLWTARRSNHSILKEISPKYSLEGLMLKVKLHTLATWYEELNHLERYWCWKRLKVAGEGDGKGWDGWMASLTQWSWVWVTLGVHHIQGSLVSCSPCDCKELDTTEWLNWTSNGKE